jgi:Family of unknown function (DUF5988)
MSSTRIHHTLDVVLEGGPSDIPRRMQVSAASVDDGRLRIERLGGYEHFECVTDEPRAGGPDAMLFRWAYRTRAAE